MVIIIAALGAYAYSSMTNASKVVEGTFDRPLMAINFARSASQVFAQLEIEVLEQMSNPKLMPQNKEVSIIETDPINQDKVTFLLGQFKEDLSVAKERSISPRAADFFNNVDRSLSEWEKTTFDTRNRFQISKITAAQDLADNIKEDLDIIVELQMNESFREREQSVANIELIRKYNLWAVGLALAITLILSAWVAVTIINPLKAAATAARKISAGNFNAVIPPGGDDETGVLLKTLSSMQENIRNRVEKEQDQRTLAQQRLSDSLKNSKDAILLTNPDGIIIVANPKVKTIFPSLETVDLVGETFDSHFYKAGYTINDTEHYNEDTSEISFEDGRWARVSASKTQEEGWLYIWNDISEIKHYAADLEQAKEAAEAADQAKTKFLAAMSHELRTPLNAVIGFSDVLEAHHSAPNGNQSHAEMASLISKNGAQLLHIVKDVLMVANGTNDEKISMDMTELDMSNIVDYCMKTVTADANKNNIRLIWTPPTDAYPIKGDTLRLQQLLLNLLSNAMKFNKTNGAIKVQLAKTNHHYLRLDVIDNGIGIDDADLDRIMEPFVQVDIGNSRKYDGVGVGLTVVNKILQSHDGRLSIQSKLGKGTCVSIFIPLLTQSKLHQNNVIKI